MIPFIVMCVGIAALTVLVLAMKGGKKAGASAPPLPAQSSAPSEGFVPEGYPELKRALAAGNAERVTAILQGARTPEMRCLMLAKLANESGRSSFLDKWVQGAPDSAEAHLVSGANYLGYAWEARGSGKGSEVTDDAGRLFIQRAATGAEHLKCAAQLAPVDPAPWVMLLAMARAEEITPEEVIARLDEAVRRSLHSVCAYRHAMWFFSQKWFGSHEEMFEIVERGVATAPPGHDMHALVADAHFQVWFYRKHFENDAHAERYFMQPAVYDSIVRHYRLWKQAADPRRNEEYACSATTFGFALYNIGEMKDALAELDSLKGNPVGPVFEFMIFDAAAYGRCVAEARKRAG